MTKLKSHFFQNEDTLTIAKNLLGKFLVSSVDNTLTSGIIIETEAYLGEVDRASHAFERRSNNRKSSYRSGLRKRTRSTPLPISNKVRIRFS